MKHHLETLFAAVLAIAFSVSVGVAAARTDPAGGTGGNPINSSLLVRVVHAGTGEAFEGAFVMVGSVPGVPFPDNWGSTSVTGEISFNHPDLQGPVLVTAGAPGYCYFTLVSVDADDLVIPLKPIISEDPVYEVGDYVSGIDVNNGLFHAGDGNVDMAFVLPTMKLEDLMSFNMESLMAPPESVYIGGQASFEVPSNFFLPQQWELLTEIIKDHYYLYLPSGDYTLAALSGRIPLSAFQEGGDITDMLTAMSWREIDILDLAVSGNTYSADLYVDPDLTQTVTLNLDNIPDNSSALCISAGDLDNRAGMGRVVPLGISALDCPGGSGPCAGTVSLTTTAAVGEFAGMVYFPVVAVDFAETEDLLVVTDREPHSRNYTENINSFFSALDLAYPDGVFEWNDVENAGNGSPDVHVQVARVRSAETEEVFWEFMIPGDVLSFTPPCLPPEAPPGLVDGGTYTWEQIAIGLGYESPLFDFNDFAFSDIIAHGSHLALDKTGIVYRDPIVDVPEAGPSFTYGMHASTPNPFGTETTIRFELPAAADIDLSIYTVTGSRITTLSRGRTEPGSQCVVWHGRDAENRNVPTGVYLARLRVDGHLTSLRVLRVR